MAKVFFYDMDIVKLLLKKEKLAGGAAVQSSVWIKGLTDSGHMVYVGTYGDHQDNSIRSGTEHIEMVSLYDKNKGIRKIRMIYYRLPSIYKTLRRVKPDYLYQSIPSWESFFLGVFCRMLKIKFIIRIANDNVLDRGIIYHYPTFRYKLLYRGIKLSDYVLCQNDYQFGQLKLNFPGKNALKIHNPFVFEEREQRDISEKKYIAWVAKIRYVKNLKLLYEIAVLMEEEQFEIAGTYTRKDPETDKYLAKLKSLENVNFRGQVEREEILNFLAEAKYLLNTSRYEGFSNTYLEAMSVGTPVLATQNANPDQILDKQGVGIIYQDSEDLRAKLDQLSADDYRQMSVHSIEYVKENHDHIRLTRKLMQFLDSKN